MLWLILNLVMFLVWWAYFKRRHSKEFSLAERMLAAFVATIAQIEASIFITGWLHILGWLETVSLNVIITVIVGRFAAKTPQETPFILEVISPFIEIWKIIKSNVTLQVIGLLALFGFFFYMYLGQLMPPMASDPWGYHLSWAALAHQERHLGPFEITNPYINYFPKNTDILFLWTIIGSGSERWANTVQGYFGLAAIISCYLLAKSAGAARRDAFASALLLLSVPVFLHMQWKAMVDLAVMGGALASIVFVTRNRVTLTSCILAGLACGFMLGSKGSTIFAFFTILLLLIYRMFPWGMYGFSHLQGKKLIPKVLPVIVFLVVTFCFGSYFYVRNWVLEGNPTGNYKVEFAGITIFEGTKRVEDHFARYLLHETLYDALEEGSEWPIVFEGFFDPQKYFHQGNRIGGWGAVWTAFLLPAIPIALIWAVVRRKWKTLAIILACIIPYFLFRYNHTWTRYHLMILGAGVVSFAWLIGHLRRTVLRNRLLGVAAAFMFLSIFISGYQFNLSPDEIHEARTVPYLKNDRFVFFNDWGNTDFADALKSIQVPGTTIGATHTLPNNKPLAFWNPTFTNRVVWVQLVSTGPIWYNELISRHVDYVYIGANTRPANWALAHPDKFEEIYVDDSLGMFLKVLQPE
jgi:hypothetical protein